MLNARIGEAAGVVWKTLKGKGPAPLAGLAKAAGVDADLAQMAVGWLAREGKLSFKDEGRKGVTVSLK